MQETDRRREHLGWIETALRASHRDVMHLRISAQAHFGPPDHLAFIVVQGVGSDRDQRRKIRAEAGVLLLRLGYQVALEPGRDTYEVTPLRPVSSHEEMRMIRCLQIACNSCLKR